MRLAIIDLGTNSVRFDVHEVAGRRTRRLLHREKLMVRLGENLFASGRLDRNAVRRTLQAMDSFKRTANDLRVDKIVAFGTSALREATDGPVLVRGIRSTVGIDVRVISGPEEARLIAAGILANEPALDGGDFALVDIGGGSTEISVVRDGKTIFCDSFPLGAARLQQVFLKTTPPAEGSPKELRRHVRRILKQRLDGFRVNRIVGSSGTVKALSRLCRKDGSNRFFDVDRLSKLNKRMWEMTSAELMALPGMEPKRVDLIVAGGLLLEECAERLGARKIAFTEYALRDGILHREVQLLELEHHLRTQVDLAPLFDELARFGRKRLHLEKVADLTEAIFRRLAPLHKLGDKWLTYLKLAVLYRDTGRIISPIEHARHSCYIVRHGDLPLYEPWETELVAQLVLHLGTAKIDRATIPFAERDLKVFGKLLALMRLVDALDPAEHGPVPLKRVAVEPRRVRLTVGRSPKTELALLRLQQKKDLFEQVFGKDLEVRTV